MALFLSSAVILVAAYRQALAFGGTETLPELYEAAGVCFAFDTAILQRTIDLLEAKIVELEPLAAQA